MARLTQPEFTLVMSGVHIGSEFNDRNSESALGQAFVHDGGDSGGWNAIPSAYLAWPIDERFAVGLGVNVPFGLKLEYANGWIGRFQALKSEFKTYNVNPSASWKVNDKLTVGLGIDYQRLEAELTNAVNYSAVVAQGLQQLVAAGQIPAAALPSLLAANAGLEGGAVVRGDDAAWGFNLGVLIEFSPQTRLGMAYRSTVDYEVEGSARFTAPPATEATGAVIIAGVSGSGGPLATGAATVDLKLPDIATASLSHDMGRVELLADVAWTGWSSVQELRILRDTGEVLSVTPERWQDTWRFALGAAYRLNEQWTLRGGLAYDESNVPDSTRTARLPDAQRKWVAVGARWEASDALVIDAGYAHLFSGDVGLDQDDGNALANALLNGSQESAVDIVSVQASYRFGR
jgi:long-chain fatty acid transport protein